MFCICLHQVYEDYDCMLNQTNIGQNNNKFYVIQVIKSGNTYYTWNRWGRVVSRICNLLLERNENVFHMSHAALISLEDC